MPFDYTALFSAIGAIAARIGEANNYRSAVAPAGAASLEAALDGVGPGLADNLYASLLGHQNALGGHLSYLRTLASKTLIRAVNDHQPQPDSSLNTALAWLIASMRADGQSVQACNVGGSISAASGNSSNGRVVISSRYKTGLVQEYTLAEALQLTCTADAQSGNINVGNEVVTARAPAAIGDTLSWLWPGGSGASASLVGIDPLTQDGSTGMANRLTNSSFERWTGSPAAPDGWSISAGTAGTDILESLGVYYDGSACLSFSGDGSTSSTLYQNVVCSPLEVLHLCCWSKCDSAPAAGVLELALVDGSGVITTDDQGNPNSVSANLVSIGSTFTPIYTTFRTPSVLPPTLRLRIKLTTPLTAGRTAYLDKLSLANPVQAYAAGPYISCHAGNLATVAGDAWTVTLTNDRAGQIQSYFERLFSMRSLGRILPSSGSPTIPDSLIA